MADSGLNSILEKLYKQVNNYDYLIPELHPSKPLYRYRANIDYAIDEIKNSYIYLTPIEDLNDPFDSSYIVSFEKAKKGKNTGKYFFDRCIFIRHADWYKTIEKSLKVSGLYDNYITMEDFFSFLELEVKKNGLDYSSKYMMRLFYEDVYCVVHHNYGYSASFSERFDNILMWAYYANSHKGLCLAYDINILNPSVAEQQALINSLRKVWYSSERYEDENGNYSPFIKAQEWSHEQEWRLFNKTNKGKIHFPCLKAVYLGMNFDILGESLDRLISAIKESSQDISIYICHPSKTSYQIKPIKLLI